MNVTIVEYEDLPEEEKENHLYRYASYLKVEIYGEPTVYYSDAIEPEDVSFDRGLAWVKDALLKAYKAGKEAV